MVASVFKIRHEDHSVILTSASPGDGVSFTSSPSSSRRGRSHDSSFVVPSLSLTLPSLPAGPTASWPPHPKTNHFLCSSSLHTALDHAITAATRIATHPPSPSSPLLSVSRLPTTPLAHLRTSLTIRILTPILPLSPLPPSTSSSSLSGGAKKTPCRQPNSVSHAALSSATTSQPTAARAKKRSWAALFSSPSSSSSPTSPSVSSLCPRSPSPSVVSHTVLVEASCWQTNSDLSAAMSSSSPVECMQSEKGRRTETKQFSRVRMTLLPPSTSSPSPLPPPLLSPAPSRRP